MHLKIEIYGTETNKIENHTRYRVLAHSGPNQMPKHQKIVQQNALKIRVYHRMRYYIAFFNNSSLVQKKVNRIKIRPLFEHDLTKPRITFHN